MEAQRRVIALALSAVTASATLVTSACHRTPEEFVPAASSDSASVSAASVASVATSAKPVGPGPVEGVRAKKAPSCPEDPEPGVPPLPTAKLKIADLDAAVITVDVEVARGEHDTTRGLMYRTSMPEMHGMVFELERDDHAFWMHNTCIALDLVYIDHGLIVGIVDSAPTLNDDPRRVGKMSDQVLELNAGFCNRHGVRVGQRVTRVTS